MTNSKENDWLLNRISNPNFSISDFKSVGLDVTNTSLEDADTYKNIPQIRENPQFQTDGKFDEAKFDNIYKYMAETYNMFSDDNYQEDVLKYATFHRDNIFADPSQRRQGPDIVISKEANPLRQKRGIKRLDLLENPTLSMDEVAQTQRVLANPVEVQNGADPIWHESPNDSFWTDFWNTRVLAQWDFDADKDGNPTSDPSKVVYKKGTPKLNDNGTYYYENLNGRDVYGRKVLSKLNTLTTDGSAWNKYDFFDSDDLEKSIGGSLVRNAVSILPMLGSTAISPIYIGAGVALETIKMMSVLGKVFTGSDNKFLSSVEGFTKSLEPTTSEYGQNNTWSIENFINLAGDVFKQLYEQRWLFKYAPALFNKGEVMDEAGYASKLEQFKKEFNTLDAYLQSNKKDLGERLFTAEAAKFYNAKAKADKYMEGYNKLGEIISKAYMTGVTVQEAYGEAKAQGVSDMEAALLTLGYAAGEYAILNSKLGEWILPELRMNREQMRQVAKTLTQTAQKVNSNADKVQKVEWAKNIFKLGKDIAQANYSVGKSGLKATAANALGEGIEETSEELLYDFAKSVTNLGMWIAGSDSPKLDAWDNMFDRYGMSFVGGMLGGAMFDMVPNLREARKLKNLNSEQAVQQLVYMARNGKIEEFLREVDKMPLGDKNLSATKTIDGINGKVWAQGTSTDNQDLAAKSQLRNVAKFIQNTLKAHGASVSDDALLSNIIGDLRYNALLNSTVASHYLQEYNTLCSKIIQKENELTELYNTTQDDQKNSDEFNEKAKTIKQEIKDLAKQRESYFNGDMSAQFIQDALFEMSTAVSSAYMAPTFIQYAENKTGKRITDISKTEVENLEKEYKGWKNSGFKDAVRVGSAIHKSIAKTMAQVMQEHSFKYYESFDQDLQNSLGILQQAISGSLNNLNQKQEASEYLEEVKDFMLSPQYTLIPSLFSTLGTQSEVNKLQDIFATPITEDYTEKVKKDQIDKLYNEFLANHLSAIVDPIVKSGYINPEIKSSLSQTLDFAIQYFDNLSINDPNPDILTKISKLEKAKQSINKLQHSNIVELLDQLSISSTDSEVKVSKLLIDLSNALSETADDILGFNLSPEQMKEVEEALSLINILKAQILSARTDSVSSNNLFGMNATINELDPEANLAILQSNVADAMIQDLETIETKLNTYNKIIQSNTSQKLEEQDRTSANKNILIYDRIKSFAKNIPDNWANKVEFEGVISSLSTLEKLAKQKKLKLNSDEKYQSELEMIKLDDAIYDFFQANQDKLKDIDLLKQLINVNNFNLFSANEDVFTSSSTSIDDNAVVWYIASRAALKASDFYGEYKNIIGDKLAPIPLQELGVYLGYASVINGQVIDNFCDSINKSLKEWADSVSEKEFEKAITTVVKGLDGTVSEYVLPNVQKDFILDSLIAPRFNRVAFIEGISGSGKTSAVIGNLVLLLKTYHPDSLKNLWIGHSTKDNASKLSKDLNVQDAETFDKDGLMKRISNDYVGYDSYKKDKLGNLLINEGAFFMDDNNIVKSNFKINELSEVPSLIIIDEVSRYTTLDMDLVNEFAKRYGVPVIVLGDFDQTKASGKHDITYKGQLYSNTITLSRNNFIRSPKLGVTMRPNNSQVVYNWNSLRAILPELKLGAAADKLNFSFRYFQDEKGFYGTKIYDSNSYSIELVKKDIDHLLSTLNPEEKIGFIYYDTDTEIYKLLSNATYKDRIDFKQGNSSQGLEGKYYIIDDSSELGSEQYWSDMYTGITRAIQGCIVLHNKVGYSAGNSENLSSQEDSSTNINSLSSDGIRQFAEARKNLLQKIPLQPTPTKIIPRVKDKTVATVTVTEPSGLKSEIIKTQDPYGNPVRTIITNNGLPTDEEIKQATQKANEDVTPPPAPNVEQENTSGKGSKTVLDLLLYTFQTFETSGKFDDNGNLIVSKEDAKRLDNYFGLNQLSNIQKDEKTFDYILGTLRSIVFNTPDKGELVQKIKTILKLKGDVYCTFAFKSSAPQFNNTNYGRFRKSPTEELKYMFSQDKESKNVKLKTLSLIIGENNTDVLEIPLAVLPNPLTLFKNSKFSQIKQEYDNISIQNPDMKSFQKISKLISFIAANPSIPGGKAIIDFLKVYTFNSNGIFYIDDPNWTLAKDLQSQGVSITNKIKGYDYEYNTDLKFDGQWITLDELVSVPGRSVSKIKISDTGTFTTNNQVINFVKPGQPFVYISDDITLRGQALEDYYFKQLQDPNIQKKVKLIYLVPPKASVGDFFSNLLNIMSKNKSAIKNIGNDFTSYRILKILFAQPNFEKSELNYNNTAYGEIKGLIDEISKLEGDTKAQLTVLERMVDIKGISSGVTAKEALQNYLLSIVYQLNTSNNQRIFKKENLDKIAEILKVNKIDGIFYNVQYLKQEAKTTTLGAKYDNNTYTIDNIPFMVNGKIESSSFYGNIAPIMEIIVNKITKNGTFESSTDNDRYINKQSNLTSKPTITLDSILESFNLKLPLSVQNEFTLNDLQNLTKDQILDLFRKTNHLVLTVGQNTYISKKPSNLNLTNAVISDQSPMSLNIHKFTLTLENEVFSGEFDISNNEVTLTKQAQQPQSSQPLQKFEVNSLDEIVNYKNILSAIPNPQFNKIQAIRGLNEFNEAINNLRVTPKFLQVVSSQLEEFEGDQKILLENLVNFMRSKLDSKESISSTDTSCPIVIKIKF